MTENVAIFDRGDPGGESAGNIVIQQVRGVEIDIASEVQHRGNIIIQAVDGSRIHITRFLSNSKTYQDLKAEITELERTVRASHERNETPETAQVLRLDELRSVERRFRDDVARLAGVFAVLDVDSERLRRAREHFEAGRIQEADEILNADDLKAEQSQLLADQESVRRDSATGAARLRPNALEYLVKAELAALNYKDPDRAVHARKYFEASLRSAELFENLEAFARFEASLGAQERARELLLRSLEMAPDELARAGARARLADALARLGDFDGAIADYETAAAFFESYREAPDRNFDPLRKLVRIYLDWSRTLRERRGAGDAREPLRRAAKYLGESASVDGDEAAESGDPEFAFLRAELLEVRAGLDRRDGDVAQARSGYVRALVVRESLRAAGGVGSDSALQDDQDRSAFAANLCEQAELEIECGRPLLALDRLDRAMPVLEYLASLNPLGREAALANARVLRARAFESREEFERAEADYAAAVRTLERLAEYNSRAFQADRARALLYRAEAALRAGRYAAALRALAPAILFFEDLTAGASDRFGPWLLRARLAQLRASVEADVNSDPEWMRNEFAELRARMLEFYETDPAEFAPQFVTLLSIEASRIRWSANQKELREGAAARLVAEARAALAHRGAARPGDAGTVSGLENPLEIEYEKSAAALAVLEARLLSGSDPNPDREAELMREAVQRYFRLENAQGASHSFAIESAPPELAMAVLSERHSGRLCARARRVLRRMLPLCGPAASAYGHAKTALSILYYEGFDPHAIVARLRGDQQADTRRGQPPSRPGRMRRWLAKLKLAKAAKEPDFATLVANNRPLPTAMPVVAPILAPPGSGKAGFASSTKDSSDLQAATPASNESGRSGDTLRLDGVRDQDLTTVAFETTHRDIQIQNLRDSRLDITLYLSRSTEYGDLEARIARAREEGAHEILDDLDRTRRRFREDVQRLAETFEAIVVDTERLRTARALFQQGRFREADAVLVAESLREQQEELLLEKERLAEREAEIRRLLENNADEFLIKARMTLLRLDLPDRFTQAREYLEASLRAAETYSNTFEYAAFVADQRDFAAAVEYYERALKFPISIGRRLGVLNNMAAALAAVQELDRACEVYERILKIEEELAKDQPEMAPETTMTLSNYAIVLKNAHRYTEAVQVARRAVGLMQEYRRARPGRHGLQLAHAQVILAQSLKYTAETDEAVRCARSAVSLVDREYASASSADDGTRRSAVSNEASGNSGASSSEDRAKAQRFRAHALTELLSIAVISQNHEAALPYYKDAVAASEALYALNPGQYGYPLSVCLESAAWIVRKAEDLSGGRTMLERAVQLREELYKRSPEAGALHLARAYDALGRYLHAEDPERAIACFERSVELLESLAQRDPDRFEPELLAVLESLTSLQSSQERYADMLPRCERQLQLVNERPWAKDPALEGRRADERVDAYYEMSRVKWELENPAAAIPYLTEALRVEQSRPDPSISGGPSMALDLMRAHLAKGDVSAAEAIYAKNRPQLEQMIPEPTLVEREVEVLSDLAGYFRERADRIQEIGPLFERQRDLYANARRMKVPVDFRPAQTNTLLDLAGFYAQTGRSGPAAKCFREARDLAGELYGEDPESHAFALIDCLYNMVAADESGMIDGEPAFMLLLQAASVLEKHEAGMQLDESQPLRLEVAAGIYGTLAHALLKQASHEETIGRMMRAIHYRRLLAQGGVEGPRAKLAQALAFVAVSQFNHGGPEAAVDSVKEAVAILADIAPGNESYRGLFEMALGMLPAVGLDPQEYLNSLKDARLD